MRNLSLLLGAFGLLSVGVVGCSSSDDDPVNGTESPSPSATVKGSEQPSPAPTTTATTPGTTPPPPGADRPGAAPAGCTGITKDKDGFFTRTTPQGSYVGFVPKSYSGQPTTLVVGIHGCGDSALHFAQWAVNPYKTIATQDYISISIGGRDGQCWDTKNDEPKVTAAITDISSCFYVHQQKIVLAGYSSGGILAYKMGITQSAKYAGIIIENSGLGGTQPTSASWKINVAHIAHLNDDSFPIAGTRADWTKLEAAGIPLQKKEVPGTHDGTSDDWSDFLMPKIAAWKAP